jgi:chromosome partitioning protein
MSAKIVAFINFKGGVGKTANAVNLGAYLAADFNKKVLVVDLDAQSNTTFWLLQPMVWRERIEDRKRTTYQIFADGVDGSERFDFDQAVIQGTPRDGNNVGLIPNLHLLPASIGLIEVEARILEHKNARTWHYLRRQIVPHRARYDYIFLDCPPNIFAVVKNALCCADAYIVPYNSDYLSLSGFRLFANELRNFRKYLAKNDPRASLAQIKGIIINRFRQRGNVYADAIDQLEFQLNGLRVDGLVDPTANILEPYIRDCTGVAGSADEHLPVNLFRSHSIGAQDYQALAANFIQVI